MIHGPAPARLDGVSDYVERLIHALDHVGVAAISVPVRGEPKGWARAMLRAAREVWLLRPDVVHVQFAPSAYRFSGLPGLLPPLLPPSVPLVTTLHEYGWWAAPGWVPAAVWRPLERTGLWDRETGRLVPASAAVVVTNREHDRQVRLRTGGRPIEVPLAPNVADHGARAAGKRHGEVLAFFGFVHPVKGIRYLLEAVASLRARRPGLRLLVVGGFTSQALPETQARAFRAELTGLAERLDVAEAVTFTGHLPAPAVSAALHTADVGVLPFTAGVTAKSGALLTMLAHGLPTAITVPDEPDLPLPGVAVIPARRDAAAIAHTVERLLDDAALRRRLSQAGRRLAGGRSWSAVAAAHRALYDRLLGAPARAAGSVHPAGQTGPRDG